LCQVVIYYFPLFLSLTVLSSVSISDDAGLKSQ